MLNVRTFRRRYRKWICERTSVLLPFRFNDLLFLFLPPLLSKIYKRQPLLIENHQLSSSVHIFFDRLRRFPFSGSNIWVWNYPFNAWNSEINGMSTLNPLLIFSLHNLMDVDEHYLNFGWKGSNIFCTWWWHRHTPNTSHPSLQPPRLLLFRRKSF